MDMEVKRIYRFLFALHLFVGIGAVFGGLAAMMDPEEPLGITVEALKNSPFKNYLIPGVILFSIIGLGNIFSAVVCRLNTKFQGYISSVFSWALIIWIVVQCIMLETVAIPHVLYFVIGVVGAVLSAMLLFKQRLFPTNILLNLIKVKNKQIGNE